MGASEFLYYIILILVSLLWAITRGMCCVSADPSKILGETILYKVLQGVLRLPFELSITSFLILKFYFPAYLCNCIIRNYLESICAASIIFPFTLKIIFLNPWLFGSCLQGVHKIIQIRCFYIISYCCVMIFDPNN